MQAYCSCPLCKYEVLGIFFVLDSLEEGINQYFFKNTINYDFVIRSLLRSTLQFYQLKNIKTYSHLMQFILLVQMIIQYKMAGNKIKSVTDV